MSEKGDHPTCQHRIGRYEWGPYWRTREESPLCGKRATHAADYPGKPTCYYCRKHSKSRSYLRELLLT